MRSQHMILLIGLIAVTAIIAVPITVYAMSSEILQFDNIRQYIAFENKMKAQLNMPIIPTNYLTGLPESTKQITTDYTLPRFHENIDDPRIIVFIEKHADKIGQIVIDEQTAKQRGWIFATELLQ